MVSNKQKQILECNKIMASFTQIKLQTTCLFVQEYICVYKNLFFSFYNLYPITLHQTKLLSKVQALNAILKTQKILLL